MKKSVQILIIVLVVVVAFSAGFFLKQPQQQFDSCKSAYDNLVNDDLCVGKFQEYWGMDSVIGNVEYFDFNWDEDLGNYGETKDYVGGVEQRCYGQAQRQFIETGERENLINCFANQIEIKDNILEIQCGCFFG
jgi:hypothetical protein|tara:strand:+ start:96 stop:497 length:402 start_codon:yes stop_codon:yes gene_type:complete